MKKKLIAVLSIMIGVIAVISIIISIMYPICLKIDFNTVSSANITYYGDGVDQTITEERDIKKLVKSLNSIRFKKGGNMSHLSQRSGVLIVELYDNKGKCIEDISFYEWAYRDGEYLIPMRGFGMDRFYSLCNDLCGNPFYGGNKIMNFATWLIIAVAIIVPITVYVFGDKKKTNNQEK